MADEATHKTPSAARRPLAGVRVVELAGLGPAPMASMLLAELGADVVRVDRPTRPAFPDVLDRARRSVASTSSIRAAPKPSFRGPSVRTSSSKGSGPV